MTIESTSIFFEAALLPDGWHESVRIEVDDDGDIVAIDTEVAPDDGAVRAGIAVAGLPNGHSHAFQRALVGRTELRANHRESFWTWRNTMYGLVRRMTPAALEAVAAQAYVEMLEAGFTAVGEFHYLHHGPDGRPYSDLAEMGGRIVAAADETGIGLTLLPVLYSHGGFDREPLDIAQRSFFNELPRFQELVARTRALVDATLGPFGNAVVGTAGHSLRAVDPSSLAELVVASASPVPFHIHVAEQVDEVEQCLAWSRRRPVEWLLDNFPVDRNWTLVHATHTTAEELSRIASANATVVLAPSTEANLGDGVFDAASFVGFGGRLGIGTDAQVRIDAAEELRLLEYGQRLTRRT